MSSISAAVGKETPMPLSASSVKTPTTPIRTSSAPSSSTPGQALIRQWNTPVDEPLVNDFFSRQLNQWPEVSQRFADLEKAVLTRDLDTPDFQLQVQHNPMRIGSTNANVNATHLKKRPCFLCDANRPAQQLDLPVLGAYHILVNPFPILPGHLTIPTRRHLPQEYDRFAHVVDRLAWNMPHHLVFYNGAHCGASAPDHAHLQAGMRGIVPIEKDWRIFENRLERIYPSTHEEEAELEEMGYSSQNAGIFLLKGYACPAFVVRGIAAESNPFLLHKLLDAIPRAEGASEPDFNLLAWRQAGANTSQSEHIVNVVFPRRKHRPDCYFAEGRAHCLVSPGAIDMGGLLVTPRREDFDRMTPRMAENILREVTITESELAAVTRKLHTAVRNHVHRKADPVKNFDEEPLVSVGIMSGEQVAFRLNGRFTAKGHQLEGEQRPSMPKAPSNGTAMPTVNSSSPPMPTTPPSPSTTSPSVSTSTGSASRTRPSADASISSSTRRSSPSSMKSPPRPISRASSPPR